MAKNFSMISKDYLNDPLYFEERFTRSQAFLDLCLNACYTNRSFKIRGNRVDLTQGQLSISLRDLAVRWKWSVNTVKTFILELKNSGYIDTQKTSVNQVITIKRYLLLNTQNNTQDDTQNDTPIRYNNKDNNKEDIKEKDSKESKKKKEELDFSIVAPDFLEVVTTWLQYKKERKESYKPSGFVKMYAKLVNLSGNNPQKAKMIIEQSMANNWAGFFALKQESLPLGFIQHDDGLEKYKDAETW